MFSHSSRFSLVAVLFVSLFSLLFATQISLGKTGPRIINGTEATLNTTRHQVSVRNKLFDSFFFGTGHLCGGSLIEPNVVLSAAHCFVNYNSFSDDYGKFQPDDTFIVVMGNLDRFEQNNDTLVYNIKKIVYYVEGTLNLTSYEHDVALLFLNESVPVNHTTVSPIRINHKTPSGGTVCQVTGWGTTETGEMSDKLMTVDLPIIDIDVCRNESEFDEGTILPDMLCAGYLGVGERDACNGDSGGPLVCNRTLAGVVSTGSGCAEPLLPGIYANVAYFSTWIDAQIKAQNNSLSLKTNLILIGVMAMLALVSKVDSAI